MTSQLSIYCKHSFLKFLKSIDYGNAIDGSFGRYQQRNIQNKMFF